MSTHQEKQRIFDEYAKSQEFEDFNDLINHYSEFADLVLKRIFAACDLVQAEQQKRIAENAKTKTVFTAHGTQQAVNKDSIINPENIIS